MLPEHHHRFYRLQVLLSSVVECWDKLRETSISVLMSLETPLPGIDDPAAVEDLVQWACKLVGSPRVRESDAGTYISQNIAKLLLALLYQVELRNLQKHRCLFLMPSDPVSVIFALFALVSG